MGEARSPHILWAFSCCGVPMQVLRKLHPSLFQVLLRGEAGQRQNKSLPLPSRGQSRCLFGPRTGAYCTPKAAPRTFQTFPRCSSPASEAAVNSSVMQGSEGVYHPFPHLKQLGWDSNPSWHLQSKIPSPSLVGFIEQHGICYISVRVK